MTPEDGPAPAPGLGSGTASRTGSGAVAGEGPYEAAPLSVELTSAGPRLSREAPRRPDTPDAVLVAPALIGVCRSDLKEIGGRRPGPSQFGHELVGLVTRSSTPLLPAGSRVCLDPNVPLRRGTGFARRMWAGGEAGALARALP
ncbi:MAG: alcohol dehydrogenase catalytic domain-containing protein, partial [Actinoallomurus sp.]